MKQTSSSSAPPSTPHSGASGSDDFVGMPSLGQVLLKDHPDAAAVLAESSRLGRAAIEEIANAVTHGLGLVAALVLSPILILAAPAGTSRVAVVVYCVTMVMLFGASTLYHGMEETRFGARWSNRLQLFDHVAIYLFIAGSYTPFLGITLEGSSLQWPMLLTVWSVAFAGIVFKLLFGTWGRRLSVASYVLLSWISLAVLPELAFRLTAVSSWLLVIGGAFYMGGIWFYFRDSRKFHHAIWHVFVFAGAAAHVASVAVVLEAL